MTLSLEQAVHHHPEAFVKPTPNPGAQLSN
jgi:hypothetical protein